MERVKYRFEAERELLKNLMNANIWLSTLDRNEALLLHDTRSTELSELNDLISKSRLMLGVQSRQAKPEPKPALQPAKEAGKREIEKKFPYPIRATVSTVL